MNLLKKIFSNDGEPSEKQILRALKQVKNDNSQGEYYLPDVIPIFIAEGKKVSAVKTENFNETRGINNVEQLREAETILNTRRSIKKS